MVSTSSIASPTSPIMDIDSSFKQGLFRTPALVPLTPPRRRTKSAPFLPTLSLSSPTFKPGPLHPIPTSAKESLWTPTTPSLAGTQSQFQDQQDAADPPAASSSFNRHLDDSQRKRSVSKHDTSPHQRSIHEIEPEDDPHVATLSAPEKLSIKIPLLKPLEAHEVVGHYRVIKPLVSGSFSLVKLAQNISNGQLVALKHVSKKSLESTPVLERGIINEIEILKAIHHPNIVKLFDYYSTPTEHILALEYISGGDLFNLLAENHPGGIPVSLSKLLFHQLLKAVEYLHGKNIVHRDIKLENVLLDPCKGAPKIKLTDFGFSTTKDVDNLNEHLGSEEYAAPELILRKPYSGKQTDAWALGVVLFALLSGSLPFSPYSQGMTRYHHEPTLVDKEASVHERPTGGKPLARHQSCYVSSTISRREHTVGSYKMARRKMLYKICRGDYGWPQEVVEKKSCPDFEIAQDLVAKFLDTNAERRWTVGQGLKHEWFQDKEMGSIIASSS